MYLLPLIILNNFQLGIFIQLGLKIVTTLQGMTYQGNTNR